MDSRDFRNALGCFATGVTVVTTLAVDGRPVGLTANAFSSVSLDPPLVLFCLDKGTMSFDAFRSGAGFAVNVLEETQQMLSVRFADTASDKWNGIAYETWETGAPILEGCVANLDCSTEAVHDAGDHIIVVGRVLRLRYDKEARPLLYYRGRYTRFGERN